MQEIPFKRAHEISATMLPNVLRANGATRIKSPRPRRQPTKSVTPARSVDSVGSTITTTVLTVSNMCSYGNLYVDFLKARREIFIDEKGWGLPVVDGMEFDQYDTPYSRWVVLHEYGKILAGVRLLPTTAKCGMYSYMIRDAQIGLLSEIPRDVIFFEAPVKEKLWEASRLFITHQVPATRRREVQTLLMKAMLETPKKHGATHLIGIVPAVWSRWLRRMNVKGLPAGPKLQFGKDKSQAVLLALTKQV